MGELTLCIELSDGADKVYGNTMHLWYGGGAVWASTSKPHNKMCLLAGDEVQASYFCLSARCLRVCCVAKQNRQDKSYKYAFDENLEF